jgi:hypothetical protein
VRIPHSHLSSAALLGAVLLICGRAFAQEPALPGVPGSPGAPGPQVLNGQGASADQLPPAGTATSVFITGAAITAGFYGLGFGTSYLWPNSPAAQELRIPVAGPWMALPQSGCGRRENGCRTLQVVLRSILSGLSAVGQTGGMALMVESFFIPSQRSVRGASVDASRLSAQGVDSRPALGSHRGATAPSQRAWYAAPLVTDSTFGLTMGGAF